MDFKQIQELIKMINKSNIGEVSIEVCCYPIGPTSDNFQEQVLVLFFVDPILQDFFVGDKFEVLSDSMPDKPGEGIVPVQDANKFTDDNVYSMFFFDMNKFMADDLMKVFIIVCIHVKEYGITK